MQAGLSSMGGLMGGKKEEKGKKGRGNASFEPSSRQSVASRWGNSFTLQGEGKVFKHDPYPYPLC